MIKTGESILGSTNKETTKPTAKVALEQITPASSGVGVTIYEKIYQEDLPIITATVRDKYFSTPIPIDIYLKEAEGYSKFLEHDSEAMEREGFNPQIRDLFFRRVAAARVAQGLMKTTFDEIHTNTTTFKELIPEAEALREKILGRMIIIAAKQPKYTGIIKDISKGKRISDTIQDLLELGQTGEQMLNELEELTVSAQELTRAKEIAVTMGRIHTASKMDSQLQSESRTIRNQSLTLLSESIKEVRLWATTLYKYGTQERTKYFSEYLRARAKKNRLEKKKKLEAIKQKKEAIETTVNAAV